MSGKGELEIAMENVADHHAGEINVINPLLVKPDNGEEVDGEKYDRISETSNQKHFGLGTNALCTQVNTTNLSSYMKLDGLTAIYKGENNIQNGYPMDEHGCSFGKKCDNLHHR